ncbi:uncharacterized [Tachysurus ichikawai]
MKKTRDIDLYTDLLTARYVNATLSNKPPADDELHSCGSQLQLFLLTAFTVIHRLRPKYHHPPYPRALHV